MANMIPVKILDIKHLTHDVKGFKVEKPNGYNFNPGQATSLAIENPDIRIPLTLTSLPRENYLEFTIKIYKERHKITEKLDKLKIGDNLLIKDESYGAIHYQGKGTFIAGGAGITPFLAILRDLRERKELNGNTLIFSNKTKQDIILEEELKEMEKEGLKLFLTLTRENNSNYLNKRINEEFLKENIKDFSQNFYICGPIRMIGEIQFFLKDLGASPNALIFDD